MDAFGACTLMRHVFGSYSVGHMAFLQFVPMATMIRLSNPYGPLWEGPAGFGLSEEVSMNQCR